MPRSIYHEINLHIVWRTKDNAAVLTDQVENRCHHYLKHRALEFPGLLVHAIGGMPDHVHLAVSVPPALFGNVLIGLAWFWRYRIAIQRVRWSNY